MENMVIERIADAIVVKLLERSRRLLLVYTGSPLGLDRIDPELQRLTEEGYRFSVFATESAQRILDIPAICRCLGAEDHSSLDPKGFLKLGTALLLPSLTQNTAAKLALGMNDTPVLNILSGAIMRGYEVVASTAGCCPDSPERQKAGLDKLPVAYREMMAGHLRTLESFGLRLTRPEEFYDTVRLATRVRMVRVEKPVLIRPQGDRPLPISSPFSAPRLQPEQVPPVRSQVITLSDIITLGREATLEMPGGALLTPPAREYIKDMQITIVRRD